MWTWASHHVLGEGKAALIRVRAGVLSYLVYDVSVAWALFLSDLCLFIDSIVEIIPFPRVGKEGDKMLRETMERVEVPEG